MQQFVEVAELRLVGEERFVPTPPAVDVAQQVCSDEKHLVEPTVLTICGEPRGIVVGMESRPVSASEWRELSEAEQRSMIWAGMTDFEDLLELVRAEVEEMLAKARPIPS